ncbi:hypothetical protein BDU57DRAFT_445927 [Ampelomyces quisqualis]|uniref:Integral membrane protein TmpA n=1 Tax=Ampelomyces quisqualis TaxID=50730 RepID=A0A6A5QUH4_AMPQU|nr:hypothetical protein BDU57DRAFT_445927 [Ampelomyces quisqualis]
MHTSSVKACQYQGWWERRAQRDGRSDGHASDGALILPLPSFPALDFDPSQFTLPPTYDEVLDLEKALYPTRPRSKNFSDTSTLYSSGSHKHDRGWATTEHYSSHQPIRRHVRVFRILRYTIFNVYRRLFTFVFGINIIGGLILLRRYQSKDVDQKQSSTTLAAFASSNFLLAILMRQDYLVNLLFRTAWLVPWSVPLRIRTMVARVYCYGGIHSGAAVAGTLWWLVFTVTICRMFLRQACSLYITIFTAIILLVLLMILVLSYPTLRAKHHNTFEMTHRFLGWSCIGLFWAQLFLLTTHTSTTRNSATKLLLHDPTFWNLLAISCLLIYPWLRIRRWTFTAHVLSSHAIRLSFPNRVHRFSCLSISSSPLKEWHPFATFPATTTLIPPSLPSAPPAANKHEASIVVSNAGDWTRQIIAHAQLEHSRSHRPSTADTRTTTLTFWTKPHPKAGVLSLSLLFPRILILTTGSGIGPALSSLLERPRTQFARLIWSTRSPRDTYGQDMLDLVKQADADAVVLDSDALGRVDLLGMVERERRACKVDAVFVLSNKVVTGRVVSGVQGRGGRAYGPIWDS